MFRTLLSIVTAITLIIPFTISITSAEGKYSIKEMTPDVQTALNNRRDRYEKLRSLKEAGMVGENNKGYVEVLGNDPEAKAIADAENNDRRFIYMTIVEQNNLPKDALATVEIVFAQEQSDRANPGDKIQQEDGRWMTK